MPRPKPPSENALLLALRQYGKAVARRPAGKEWQTIDEMAAEERVTGAAIRYRLKTAQKNGVVVETATGSALDAEGFAKRTTYYRLRNGKP